MNLPIKTKLLGGVGLLFLLVVITSLLSIYYLKRIESRFSIVTTQIYPAAENIRELNEKLRESKNWAVRYTLEEDVLKLEQWKKNYEISFKSTQSLFKNLNAKAFQSMNEALKKVQNGLQVFSDSVNPIVEKHEERLALGQFKKEKINEYISISSEIQTHLGTIAGGVVGDLRKTVTDNAALFSTPLFSALQAKPEKELQDILETRRSTFSKNIDLFDQKINGLLSNTTSVKMRQELHKAKVLSIQMRRIVLSHQQLYDLYQNEIQTLVFIWKTIEGLNHAYDDVEKATTLVSNLVNQSLAKTMETLESSQKESHVFFIFLIMILGLSAFITRVFISKSILLPLQSLVSSTKKIGEGHLDERAPIYSSDEIGSLALSFNQMAEKLKESREALEGANEEIKEFNRGLEKKVAERTKELRIKSEDLSIKNQELILASRLKSEFLANMSHELRTPLNSIIGFSDLVLHDKNQKLTEKSKKNIENVLESGGDLLELINAVLDLAKIEAGKMPVVVTEFAPADILQSSLETQSVLIDGKNIVLEKKISKNLPLCRSDATKIKQVFNNIINNAIKFTDQGKITVSLETQGGFFVFKVKDTGIGISSENQKIIFDEFRQVDASLTRKYGGSGLGLAIVKKIVKLLGGSIDVESEEGKGSCFKIIFPMKHEEAKAEELKKAA